MQVRKPKIVLSKLSEQKIYIHDMNKNVWTFTSHSIPSVSQEEAPSIIIFWDWTPKGGNLELYTKFANH